MTGCPKTKCPSGVEKQQQGMGVQRPNVIVKLRSNKQGMGVQRPNVLVELKSSNNNGC